MIFRTRIIITAALLCHLLLCSGLVTSQTPPEALRLPPPSSVQAGEEATIHAVQQEYAKPLYKLRGQAEIRYRTYILYADEITYNEDTGESDLEGHVVLDGGPYDEHIEASHANYNIKTEYGKFYDVVGTAGIRMRKSRYVLTTSNPFAFTGKVVDKNGADHYLVHHGTVTTCELPHPKWKFGAGRIKVDVDSTAKIYNSDFWLFGMPMFYFPFMTHPVQKEARQSGFLIPTIGSSSTKGFMAGDSLFWAINRAMDATIGAEYFSIRGWAQRAEFRARPSETSYVDLGYFGVLDRGIGFPPQNQGGEEIHLNSQGTFGKNFRGVANIDYLSSFIFRIAFSDIYNTAVNSEVKSQVFLSNSTNGFNYNALAERYQNFEVCNPKNPNQLTECSTTSNTITQTELIRILHTPSLLVSGEERPLGDTPFFWSFDSAVEGLQRREVGDPTDTSVLGLPKGLRTAPLVGRLDLAPRLSWPLKWRGWSATPELTLRDTFYTQEFNSVIAKETGKAHDDAINRKALEGSFELRPPALEKIFDRPWLRRRWKHVVEPRVNYRYVTGVNNFGDILRFDSRDLLSNTNEVEYAVENRIYAKPLNPETKDCGQQGVSALTIGGAPSMSAVPWEAAPPPETIKTCASGPREVLSWEVAQKYFFDPTFGGALVAGTRNVFTSTADFTGINFLTDRRSFSPIISRLRLETSPRTNTEWDLDYDTKKGRINASTALVNYRYGPFTTGGGDSFLRISDLGGPGARDFHQFRVLFGYGDLQRRGFNAASSFGFDANRGFLQYSTVQTTYNWDCCGLSVEYRRFALGLIRNENQFRFSFSLANVGAFGNLRRQERLF